MPASSMENASPWTEVLRWSRAAAERFGICRIGAPSDGRNSARGPQELSPPRLTRPEEWRVASPRSGDFAPPRCPDAPEESDLGAPMKIAILDDYQNVAAGCADWSPLATSAELTFFHDHVSDVEALVARLAP